MRYRSNSRGSAHGVIVIALALVALLYFALTPGSYRASSRSKTARVKADLRSLAIGLEAYYVDQGAYPAWVSLTGSNKWTGKDGLGHINAFSGAGTGASSIHSFRVWTASPDESAANQYFLLTTPVSYVSAIMRDPFAYTRGTAYGYYSTASRYIIFSYGPDSDEQPNAQGHVGDIDPAVEATDLTDLVTGQLWSILRDRTLLSRLTLSCGPPATWLTTRGTGAFTYDPTNGTTSEGDLWRIKR